MLTPEYLQGAPAELEALFLRLEEDVIRDICRRIAKEGRLTDSAEDQVERLRDLGAGTDYIKRKISEYSELSSAEVDRLFFDAAQTSDEFYRNVYNKANKDYTPYEYNDYFQQAVDAAVNQTKGELRNLTQSMGFSYRGSNGQIRFHTAAEAYRDCLDYAFMQTSTGMTDYNTAVRNATRRLTESGLQFVDYASGVRNHADVAVRRAVLTGLSQYTGKIAEHNMQELDTDIVEVDAHSGARPDHAEWQGRWFSFSGKSKEYPSLVEVTGYGTVTGLKGANCRHDFYPVIPGISEPSYTEEELRNIDPPPFEYDGKTYTYYEATQRQRYMERSMRKTKRELIAADSTGDKDRFTEKSVLLRRQKEEYNKFSKSAGLLTQNERAQVGGFGHSQASKTVWAERKAHNLTNSNLKLLDNGGGSGIIRTEQQSDLGNLKQKLRSDNRVSREYYSAVKDKFSHGSDVAKKAFSKYVPQNSVANAIYEDTAYYNADTKKIYMHYGADLSNPRGKAVTWFHEHGHLIDNFAGQISDDAEFFNILQKDVMNYRLHIGKKYNIKTFDKVDKKISSSLTDMRKHSAVSDILDGVTGGNIRGCAWHAPRPDGTPYWNDKTIVSEAFAHMYEAQFDRTRYKEMSKIFPNSLKYFESKLKEAL